MNHTALYFLPTHRIDGLVADEFRSRIEIRARPAGVALLRLLGMDSKSHLTMDATGFRLETAGFTGQTRTYCATSNIAASVYVMSRPIELLVLAIALVLVGSGSLIGGLFGGGTVPMALGLLLVALAGVCLYFFGRSCRVIIGVVTNAGTAESLKLRADSAQIQKLRQQIRIVEGLLNGGAVQAESFDSSDGGFLDDDSPFETSETPHFAPDPGPAVATRPAETVVISCPHCAARLRVGPAALGKQVRCPACQQPFLAG